jgi:hypothetical protein
MRRGARSTFVAAVLTATALAGCGGGSRQDANAPTGRFPVQVTAAFPPVQRLAQKTHLTISVTNMSHKAMPNVAVTICNTTCRYPAPVGQGTSVAAFAQCLGGTTGQQCSQAASSQQVGNKSRPIWVVERPPGLCRYSCINGGAGASTSYDTNTWQRGRPLPPGRTTTFTWALTAVAPGHFVVAWEVAADLYGTARAVMSGGGVGPCGRVPCGTLPVVISRVPAQSYVTDTGQIKTQ